MSALSSRRRSSSSASSPRTSAEEDVASLRASIRPDFPEIDDLYSDAYLRSVLSVPGRAYEYARDRKIRGALEWRRAFGTDALREAFRYDDGEGFLVPNDTYDEANNVSDGEDAVGEKPDDSARFRPSAELVDLCRSGALRVASAQTYHVDSSSSSFPRRRLILHSRTALVDWWKAGVDAGLQYHVLAIEHALGLIRRSAASRGEDGGIVDDAGAPPLSESMTLLVDTEGMGMVPPPVGALRGMVGLLQQAYPDRIHRIVVFPVGGVLRGLYELVSPMMAQRSRDKIVLAGDASEALAVQNDVEANEG